MFETILMQIAEDNILTSIVSIVGSLTIILPIAIKYISKLNHRLEAISQYGDTFGQKGAEILDDLYVFADAFKTTAPELEKYINTKYGKNIEYFRKRADIAAKQAERFQEKLKDEDSKLLASSLTGLPREHFPTEPGQSIK